MAFLTLNQFKKLYINCNEPKEWFDAMMSIFSKTSINTIPRQAAFIAQCGHESGGWRVFSENLNYSSTALNKVFPKYFKRAGRDASKYHRKPEMIANVVYANRMGNGNTQSGDGWRYRGRGPIQLTGKNNYTEFQKYLQGNVVFHGELTGVNVLRNPDLVANNRQIAILSAVWFWEKNNLNKYCDSFNIKTLTKRINGGYNGLNDRIHHYSEALHMMTGTLRRGDTGTGVEILQSLIGSTVDGDFGPNTERLLKRKQQELHLIPDGIAGQKTILKLVSL